jgi:hypothetical protein
MSIGTPCLAGNGNIESTHFAETGAVNPGSILLQGPIVRHFRMI